jgi:chaperonin GroES
VWHKNFKKKRITIIKGNHITCPIPELEVEIKMKIEPMGERVLIKPVEKQEKTKGGIYIPEAAKEERKEGEVVGVGSFKDGKRLPLKNGDRVLYGGYSSEEIEIDKTKYIFVDFKDVLAKIE